MTTAAHHPPTALAHLASPPAPDAAPDKGKAPRTGKLLRKGRGKPRTTDTGTGTGTTDSPSPGGRKT